MRYEGLDLELAYELERHPELRWSREMDEVEVDIDAAQRAAEKGGKRGYEVAEIIISAYRTHRHIQEVHSLAIDENTNPRVIGVIGHVTLTTGEDLRFASYIDR